MVLASGVVEIALGLGMLLLWKQKPKAVVGVEQVETVQRSLTDIPVSRYVKRVLGMTPSQYKAKFSVKK